MKSDIGYLQRCLKMWSWAVRQEMPPKFHGSSQFNAVFTRARKPMKLSEFIKTFIGTKAYMSYLFGFGTCKIYKTLFFTRY